MVIDIHYIYNVLVRICIEIDNIMDIDHMLLNWHKCIQIVPDNAYRDMDRYVVEQERDPYVHGP